MARRRPTIGVAVLDTMVFAYALLGVTKHRDQAAAILERVDEIVVPDILHSELTNVVSRWVRAEKLPIELGRQTLRDAAALMTWVEPAEAIWERALELAVEHEHPAYDTMYVALAERVSAPLITYDTKLARLFPKVVMEPDRHGW